ncbi:MAG TPA: PIG-L family deacetylase [Pyrinomonadaceae bacterium]|jgi:LmbE family N-acetylglucosaminyl deacetylase|nr:PIG-L family deacetylase [Pyrinomonadaceae bacterium]
MRTSLPRTPSAVLLLLLLFTLARAQAPVVRDAAETGLTLRKLGVTGSVLYVGAHPDDENTAMLAYLANERGARTAYLSVTRGEGGQNLIGSEKGELLGLIRTQELLAARRIDGSEQFFTRAVDFGFTKSPDEALRVWGHDEVLADVVWVVRRFRPDVIIARFPTTGEGGHGQHTASAILAREAFDAAADPARFPEQLNLVKPWKAKRLLWNVFNFRSSEPPAGADQMLAADLGAYNPLLGRSYTELAAQSRSQHKSQGMGAAERRGPAVNYLSHVAGERATKDIFDGVDLTWRRFEGGDRVGRLVEEAARKFDPANPQGVLPLLVSAHKEMRALKTEGEPLIEAKRAQLLEAVRACAGLWLEALAAEPYVVPGAMLKMTATALNRSDFPLRLETVQQKPAAPPLRMKEPELKNNQPLQVEFAVGVPDTAAPSQPYWLRTGHGNWAPQEQSVMGQPETYSVPPILFTVAAGPEGERLVFEVPVLYRWTDRVRGELYRPAVVVPAVALGVEEKVLVFPDSKPKPVRVTLRNNGGEVAGKLRLKLPAGWAASPAEVPAALKARGEEFKATFTVTPPASQISGTLAAEFEAAGGRVYRRSVVEIDYPHIPRQTLFPQAEAALVRADIERRGARVGYVMGSGDEMPEALRQVGYEVVLLSDEDLENADLSKFDAVVTGVRAYNTRAALRRQQPRLVEYVERGGTLVVQYNTPDRTLEGAALGPFPFRVSQDRVTDEAAAVELLAPSDALLNAPNKIGPADFSGWVQERGLYFAGEWDARYAPLFSSRDPGEKDLKGSTLVARHGRGTYVYTGLAFFRQLPAGVPGAYRLFVNLLSAGKK